MKNFLQKLLPKKTRFAAIDIGTFEIKVAKVEIIGGIPEVTFLQRYPSPSGIWTEKFDEEKLVLALKEIKKEINLKEIITCIGGEKVVSRITPFPQMTGKEIEAALKFEVEKFIPIPVDQLIIRYVNLGETNIEEGKSQNILLLAVPAAIIYQFHSIFSRAGLLVTAVDLQALALWRIFASNSSPGTTAIIDIGAMISHLVIIKDGKIRFTRLLPVGGDILTRTIADTHGVDFAEAQKMKEKSCILTNNREIAGTSQVDYFLQDGLLGITRELQRSFEYCSAQENLSVEKLVLSGGTCKLKGLENYLENILGIPTGMGVPEIRVPEEFDPAFSIAIGLALREVCSR